MWKQLITKFSRPRLAILIDGDNIGPRYLKEIFRIANDIGNPVIKNIYGNWTSKPKWASIINRFALTPIHQFPLKSGKNAIDIIIAIDAMELVHQKKVDAICIASNDFDFTPLLKRLKTYGLNVYGIGSNATSPFKYACDKYFELFSETTPASREDASVHSEADSCLLSACKNLNNEDGWYLLSDLGAELKRHYPNFSVKSYGFATLSKLIKKSNAFELKYENEERTIAVIRPKEAQ